MNIFPFWTLPMLEAIIGALNSGGKKNFKTFHSSHCFAVWLSLGLLQTQMNSPLKCNCRSTNYTQSGWGGYFATLPAEREDFSRKQNRLILSSPREPLTSRHKSALAFCPSLNMFAFRLGTAVDFCLYLSLATDSIWGGDKLPLENWAVMGSRRPHARCASLSFEDSGLC